VFPSLSYEANVSLMLPFSMEEIEVVVMIIKVRVRTALTLILSKLFGV
jgi:hypothetical protein